MITTNKTKFLSITCINRGRSSAFSISSAMWNSSSTDISWHRLTTTPTE
uniref:Uncharacterized protein n=1 Tax=Anguilla anguilla TaxID=7936 RepID=A0A0E9XEB2_ANGAN